MTTPAEPDIGQKSAEPENKPGFVDRLRARWGWFDHVMRAQERYNDSKGDFYAAGITYFTVFAMFPLLMVGFSIAGFILASQPELARRDRRTGSGRRCPATSATQLVELMDSAIESRTSVGVIGLVTAAWAGLGWMANLREALSQMWGLMRRDTAGLRPHQAVGSGGHLQPFRRDRGHRRSDRGEQFRTGAQGSGMAWAGECSRCGVLLRVVSLTVSVLISWLLFTWIIARLPRESLSFRSALRAGLFTAVAFEVFKQVASIYLRSVVTGPAGATFGPVLGLMVFAYITARLILFATAWAATSTENLEAAPVAPPGLAQITPRVQVHEGVGVGGVLTAAAVGALGALGISRMRGRQ